ncbi:MAG TPA: glycosyltransferase family 39 protein [Dehalococcoidia bacterium]
MRRSLTAGAVIAILVNVVLAAAYLWSYGGQTSTLKIEIEGTRYRIWIDGNQVLPRQAPGEPPRQLLDTPLSGTISITLLKRNPAYPDPQGVDSVLVTDLQGNELYREDFDEPLDPREWLTTEGSFRVRDGVLEATSQPHHNTVELQNPGWGDQIITFKFRNASSMEIGARRHEEGRINFGVDLVRDFPIYLEGYAEDGTWTGTFFADRIHTNSGEIFKSIGGMALRSYPVVFVLGFAALVASAALALGESRLAGRFGLSQERLGGTASSLVERLGPRGSLLVVFAIALVACALTAHIITTYYTRVPHLPDESSYIWQAKLFAHGHVVGSLPAAKEAFYSWLPNFLYEHDGHWATLYPFGQPLMLVPGVITGQRWLIPPLVGFGCVVMMFLVGRRMFDTRTGMLAAALLAASPFFLMQSSNFMSHNTWVFYLLVSMYFLLNRERPVLYGALAGLFFGLVANTRTVEAAMLIPPFGLLLLSFLKPQEMRQENLKYVGSFMAGGAVMVLAMLAYNAAITGDPLEPPYVAWGADTLGFVDGHTFDIGMRTMQSHLMGLILVFHAWPVWVGLSFVLLPFILGTRNLWDYFLIACAFLVSVIYILYETGMLYMGPRYWYQAVPFLVLLTARGIEMAAAGLGNLATSLRGHYLRDTRPASWAGTAVVYSWVAVLVIWGTGGWLVGWHEDEWSELDVPQVQASLAEVEFIYGFDNRLIELEKRLKPTNALILVKPCGNYNSFACYNTVFDRNSLNFDSSVLWARYIPEMNQEIIDAYPGRTVYVADFDESLIRLYDPSIDVTTQPF